MDIDYDRFCRRCRNYQFDLSRGILCGLTGNKPAFQTECASFELDPEKERKLIGEQVRLQRAEERAEAYGETYDSFALEKKGVRKGVLGGIIMISIAIVWFFGGLAVGYIFFYPPILFLIGLYALLKGLFTGNISGREKRENVETHPWDRYQQRE